jgi:hypothetical protein
MSRVLGYRARRRPIFDVARNDVALLDVASPALFGFGYALNIRNRTYLGQFVWCVYVSEWVVCYDRKFDMTHTDTFSEARDMPRTGNRKECMEPTPTR